MKRLVSGIKPTGNVHIGNYFGAIKQFLKYQEETEAFIFIADLHALTSIQKKDELEKNIRHITASYIASGLDPNKVTIFKQSDLPEVTELAWIFNCITTMPVLMRAHAFKDAEAKDKDIDVGTFTYPILMAADILIHQADIVPVGKDQKQHVEMAREIARKFNTTFGNTFKEPKEVVEEETETITGTDGQKMSKSYGNVIPLFASDEELKKIIMTIPTDSKGVEESKNPDENNIYNIHKHLISEERNKEIRSKYEKGGLSYKEAKDILLEDLINFITPIREKGLYLENNPRKINKILKKGAKKARKNIKNTISQVREATGISLY